MHLAHLTLRLVQISALFPLIGSLTAATPWELWQAAKFSAGEMADLTSTGPLADPDQDGIGNILEYATGMDPVRADAVPQAVSKTATELEFVFTKNKAATDVTYTVEWSDDLGSSWNTDGVTNSILSDNASSQQIKALIPAGAGRRFVHLKITETATTHVDNPFIGATFYRNVDYVTSVNAAADLQSDALLGQQMKRVAKYPTFLWLDTIAAIHGTGGYVRGLAGHLDQALAQGASAIGIVIYNLPNRDGSALASNGELLIAQNGLNRYKTEYIDAIYNIISQPQYANLRIVMVIEPDSLPNLITNLSFPKVAEANTTGAYVQGVQYAVGTLRSLTNTYAYIDVAHAGWLGWPNNLNPFVTLLKQVGMGITGGNAKVDGFISNTANYNVFIEPFLTANQQIGGQPVRSLPVFYDYNDHIDEQHFATALRSALITGTNAYPTSIGLLIDTSRNGWGGPNRPTAASTSTVLSTFVRASTLDRRIHKGNWGNQSGAGIGARPVATPFANYDAFVWVKPPGESDGSSSLIPVGPENPDGKGFDRMCDPTYQGNSLNGNQPTGALPNAPVAGRWFQSQFVELVRNAYPAF